MDMEPKEQIEAAERELNVLAGEIQSAVTKEQQEMVKNRVREVLAGQKYRLPLEQICEILGLPIEIISTRKKVGDVLSLDLDQALSKFFSENLPKLEEHVEIQKINKVFVPAAEGEIMEESGEMEYQAPKVYPRFLLALDVLKKLGVSLSECWFWEGENDPDMVRGLSYRMIVVPSLGKSILLCDEEGNRTFVINDTHNPSKYWDMRKPELKKLEGIEHFKWSKPELWVEKLTSALQVQPTVEDKSGAFVVGRDGVGVYEGDQVVSIKTYCKYYGYPYAHVRGRAFKENVQPLEGVLGHPLDVVGRLSRGNPVYLRSSIDALLPVVLGEDGIGEMDSRAVVDLFSYGMFLRVPGFKKDGDLIRFMKGKIQPIPLRKGVPPKGKYRDMYWKDEVDALLPLKVGDDGIVTIPVPGTSPVEYREAVGIRKYANHIGISDATVWKRIKNGSSITAVEGANLRSGRAPIDVYWKDEVDDLLDDLLNDSLTAGVVEVDGEEYVGLQAYAVALGYAKSNFEWWIKQNNVHPVEGMIARSGVHTVELYKKSEVDALIRIRLPENGIVEIDGNVVVGLSRYAEDLGIDPLFLKRKVRDVGLTPFDTGVRKVLSHAAQVNVYLKSEVDELIDLLE